jgi:transcriptional regulator with XRE-family HTH domain
MKEIAKELGIDLELATRDLDFHRGVARGYLSQQEHIQRPEKWESIAFAATAFRRAGSNALLLDQAELARELFADSAKCYDRLRRPYSAMMWALARNLGAALKSSETSLRDFIQSEGRYPSDRFGQLTYSLLVEGAGRTVEPLSRTNQEFTGRFRRTASELAALSTSPLGIMGLPIASHLHLAASMEEQADPHDVQYFLSPFLNAFELALETARSKQYHWQRLLMPFHPAEPDIIAVLVMSDGWFRRRELKLVDFIRGRADNRLASKLLPDALERLES